MDAKGLTAEQFEQWVTALESGAHGAGPGCTWGMREGDGTMSHDTLGLLGALVLGVDWLSPGVVDAHGTHRSTSGPLNEVDGVHAVPLALARALPVDVRRDVQERDENFTPWPETAAWLREQRQRCLAPLAPPTA
ncbi:hypothetical protein WDZ17_13690 [Pseudokineococcus basanitobsidens]|uniref:PH domain-containing protein n=1 Tax=Pseudokineococcus basanitobsidens TaxID=1926649 RepID=A0ABU8RML2_9ACTN